MSRDQPLPWANEGIRVRDILHAYKTAADRAPPGQQPHGAQAILAHLQEHTMQDRKTEPDFE